MALLVLWGSGGGLPRTSVAAELMGPGPAVFEVGRRPRSLIVGEFNDDGARDLAVVNQSDDTVSILLGDGLGGFSHLSSVAVGEAPISVAVGAFNDDRHQDLAVANSGGSSVSILLGDGAGGFSRTADVTVGRDMYGEGSIPASVAVGDFDEDRDQDLAVVNRLSNTVTILLGDGLGGFRRAPEVTLAEAPFAVAVGEFNGDGLQDMAVTHEIGATVSILLGDGLGGFLQTHDLDVGLSPLAIATGMFNDDEQQDLAVANELSGSVTILLGDGLGGFSRTADLAVGLEPRSVTVGEFNGDGIQDLAVANREGDTVSILLGDGRGGFSRTLDFAVGNGPSSVIAGELNSDGVQDLAVTNTLGDSVNILLGDGLGGFSRSFEIAVGGDPRSITVGEFNGDRAPDLAVAKGNSAVNILLGDGSGGFSILPDVPVDRRPISMAVGEFDGDGAQDLALTNAFGFNTVSILRGNGLGGFEHVADFDVGDGPGAVAVGDFDGNGAQDLAAVNRIGDSVSILLGEGSGNFSRVADVGVGPGPSSIAIGEFNGDGAQDLAVTRGASDGTVTILLGDGLGGFSRTDEDPEVEEFPSSVAVGDFNGDDVEDLAVANQISESVSILLGDGAGGFSRTSDLPVGNSALSIVVDEFNGDGLPDLAVASGTVSILLGDGRGAFSRAAILGVGLGPVSITAGDFNGNGAQDLAVANRGSDTVSILLNQLGDRADLNDSNRVDGFDVNGMGLRAGCRVTDPCYRRDVDINLDGLVDGEDLNLVASRFGRLLRSVSPLRPALAPSSPACDDDTVAFQQESAEGDLLAVQVCINPTDQLIAAAELGITFDVETLEYAGMAPGSFLAGEHQLYGVNDETPGRVEITVHRFPFLNTSGSGPEPLVTLFLRAKSEGRTPLDFEPGSRLLNALGDEVPGITFHGEAEVVVDKSGDLPSQRIAVSPAEMFFGSVTVGTSLRARLRLSNLGFSDLRVIDVDSSLPGIRTFFTSPFTIPPFGFVDLLVVYSPLDSSPLSGVLVITSDDLVRGEIQIPLSGEGIDRPSLATWSSQSVDGL